MRALVRYLADELADALPSEHELSGFAKGMGWMLVLVIAALVASAVAYQRIWP